MFFVCFVFNFRGICGGGEDVMALIEPLISPIVRGYTKLYNEQKSLKKLRDGKKDEFFGLRDFYRCECFDCCNISCTNQIKGCVITPNKRPVCMNVYNEESKASLCIYPYFWLWTFGVKSTESLIFFS